MMFNDTFDNNLVISWLPVVWEIRSIRRKPPTSRKSVIQFVSDLRQVGALSVRHSDLLPRELTFHFRLFSLEICIFPQDMYNKS
jgi:hypothetical protein